MKKKEEKMKKKKKGEKGKKGKKRKQGRKEIDQGTTRILLAQMSPIAPRVCQNEFQIETALSSNPYLFWCFSGQSLTSPVFPVQGTTVNTDVLSSHPAQCRRLGSYT